MRKVIFLSLVALVASCKPADEYADDPTGGAQFKQELLTELSSTDRILVLEHSDPVDYIREGEEIDQDPPHRIYKSIEISESSRRALLSAISKMSAASPTIFAACIFSPHHTIQLYSGSKLRSELQVCYQCSDARWTKATSATPSSLVSALTPTIVAAGMQTERDWSALAHASAEPGNDK